MKYKRGAILVIDDDEATNFITKLELEDAGFGGEIKFIDSAKQALCYLNSIPEEKLPRLILLDINMPGMDGWEFADEFSRLPVSRDITTIMFSTSNTQKDRERALAHPVISDFLQKPINQANISVILENIFSNAINS